MEIQRSVQPLQIQGLKPEEAIKQISLYVESQVKRMQEEIYTLRQFIEPLVINNKDCPDQVFNPLE